MERRKERKAKGDRLGLYLIVGIVGAFGAIFAYQWHVFRQPGPDSANCIGDVSRKTVVLIDQTDPVSAQTKGEIVARVMRVVQERVQTNERVSVFGISADSKQRLVPIFSACRPKSKGDALTEKDSLVRKKFTEKFLKPIQASLDIAETSSKESPIAQAVIDLSLSDHLRGDSSTLLIVSDMMENTSKFSLYRCASSKEAIRHFRDSRIGAQERPSFKNVSVSLDLIPTEQSQRAVVECRAAFWNWFFGDSSGNTSGVSMNYLPGYGGK